MMLFYKQIHIVWNIIIRVMIVLNVLEFNRSFVLFKVNMKWKSQAVYICKF